jgi:hypothetical protein
MRASHRRFVALILASIAAPQLLLQTLGPAGAQDMAMKNAKGAEAPRTVELIREEASNKGVFSFDYGIPTSPALTLAGLSPDKAGGTSTSLKPFVVSIPTATNAGGQALALDAAPVGLFVAAGKQDYDAYVAKENTALRIGYRTRVAALVYNGDDGDGDAKKKRAGKLAFGLSTSLLDHSDPLMARLSGDVSAWDACLDRNQAVFTQEITEVSNRLAAVTNVRAQLSGASNRLGMNPNLLKINPDLPMDPNNGFWDNVRLWIEQARILLAEQAGNFSDVRLDPMRRYSAEERIALQREMNRLLPPLGVAQTNFQKASDDFNDMAFKASKAAPTLEACAKEASQIASYGQDLDLGLGAVWTGTPGEYSGYTDPNAKIWIGYRFPFAARYATVANSSNMSRVPVAYWAIGGSAFYDYRGQADTGNQATPKIKANIADVWLGLERFDEPFKFTAQVGYSNTKPVLDTQSGLGKSAYRWLLHSAVRLNADNSLWLNVTYGNASGSGAAVDDKTLVVNLSFGPAKFGSALGLAN